VVAVPLIGVVTAGGRPGPVTQLTSGRCPLWCGGSEHRLPELIVAAGAGDPDVSHAAAAARPLATGAARTL